MKRWNNIPQFVDELTELEESKTNKLRLIKCNTVANNIRNLYKEGGKSSVIRNIRATLPEHNSLNGFSMGQKDSVERIVKKLFKWHGLPWSRIRNNMVRIGAVK